MPRICIIDYGAGNLRSVANAFEAIGAHPHVTARPEDLREADGIVLPGVGAFGDGMQNLRRLGMVPALTEEVRRGKPYLGICLGMQFLAERSFEGGEVAGFGWMRGAIRKIAPGESGVKVPHMGWNALSLDRPSALFDGVSEPVFYFVHGYAFEVAPEDQDAVTATCRHGGTVVAAVERGNVFGVQFHPEKSQLAGLSVLRNFVDIVAARRGTAC